MFLLSAKYISPHSFEVVPKDTLPALAPVPNSIAVEAIVRILAPGPSFVIGPPSPAVPS